MPELSRFYGIDNKIFYNDHNPPHFHAEYGSSQMVVDVNTLAVIGGRLPPRATGLVMEWAAQHQQDLRDAWHQARNMEPLDRIDPLP
ncbi:MAG TPA: transcriptional regulator [Planctomycetaceae bacterium]|nr:transcriptional regulator [Planctomycetaceae bacterium]